jgi:hypothetical protein
MIDHMAPRETRLAWLAAGLLLAGFALTAWGLKQIGFPPDVVGVNAKALLNSTRYGLWPWLFAVVAIVAWTTRSGFAGAAGFVVCGFALIAGQFLPVLVVAVFLAASMLVGEWLLERVCGGKDALPAWSALLVGAGLLGTLAGLAAHRPVNTPGAYGVVLALPLVFGWQRLRRHVSTLRDWLRIEAVQSRKGGRLLQCAVAAAALVHLLIAFVPDLGFDALAMHLFVADALRTRREWGFDVGNYVFAVLPFLVDWTYAIVNMLGGETAARLLNACFVLGVGWLIRELVFWAGGGAVAARWALLLFFTSPLTFTESHSLFIDAGWSAFVLGGTLAMLRVLDGTASGRAGLPLAGLLWGFALAAKSVTLVVFPALLLVMLTRPATWIAAGQRIPLAIGTVLGIAAGAVPYVTAWVIARNPVFPFFNALFKSPYFAPINFEPPPFERYLSWDSIYRITFEAPKYLESQPGAGGFQWLLLLPAAALVLLVAKERRWWFAALLVLAVGGVAGVFQQTAYLRYIFPCMAVLLAMIGAGIERMLARGSAAWPICLAAACCAVGLNIAYFHTGSNYRDFPLQAAWSGEKRAELLAERQPQRGIVQPLNAANAGRSPVVWLADPLATGVVADVLYPNWYNHRFHDELNSVRTPDQMLWLMRLHGAEFAVVDLMRKPPPGIFEITDEIARSGTVSLRRLQRPLLFAHEFLAGGDFSQMSAWSLAPGARVDREAGAVVVTPEAGAFQKVPVKPRRTYLNTISSRCDKPGVLGRLQVNWVDDSGKALSVDSLPYSCSADWATHSFEVSAPKRAAFAIVYATGHYGGAVMVKSNSLKGID